MIMYRVKWGEGGGVKSQMEEEFKVLEIKSIQN